MVRTKRKLPLSVLRLACACLLLSSAALSARENPYDVLSKALIPFEKLFARESGVIHRAVLADLAVAEMTGNGAVPPGAAFRLALQTPDKLLVSGGPILGRQITACRNGKDLWACPGAQIAAMLNSEPPADEQANYVLNNIVLPIPQKQLVFLPIVFQVRDAGDEAVDGETCTILDVTLLPQLAAALKVQDWSARLWIRPNYKPAKLDLSKPGWHAAILVKKLDFVSALPPAAWQPTPEQSGDVVHITPAQLIRLAATAGLKIDQ